MITTPPFNLPAVIARPPSPRVNPVAAGDGRFGDAAQQRPAGYVYRGELLDGLPPQSRFRPQPNLQIHPQNQRAINAYRSVAEDPLPLGQLLDGLI